MLSCLDIYFYTTVLDKRQHILNFLSFMIVHCWNFSVYKQKLRWNLEMTFSRVYHCSNPVFPTTDNACISHTMKLSIVSINFWYHSLFCGSGLLHFKTFVSFAVKHSPYLPPLLTDQCCVSIRILYTLYVS